MPAYNDGRCAKCGKRIGWFGELKDKPTCHGCGHKPNEAELKELEEVEKKLAEAEKRLLSED